MDTPRVVLLVFLLIFLFVSPDTQAPTPSQHHDLQDLIVNERYALHNLATSNYGDLDAERDKWINQTGLRKEDSYAWDLFPRVQERAREQVRTVLGAQGLSWLDWNAAEITTEVDGKDELDRDQQNRDISLSVGVQSALPLYQNITGLIKGQWVCSKLLDGYTSPRINLTATSPSIEYSPGGFDRNITGESGTLRIKLDERRSEIISENGSVRQIRADMTIKDDNSSGDGWEMTLHGIHYPDIGAVLLSTTSERFAGIFALPQFALSEHAFFLARSLLNKTLTDTISRQESSLSTHSFYPWSSSSAIPSNVLFPKPHCEYLVYLQQHPVKINITTLDQIEEELRYPSGAPLPKAPEMSMSAIIFSPDCGFVLESKGPPDYTHEQGSHLSGPKLESYQHKAKHLVLMYALVECAQLVFLKRQMSHASTPSTRSRISFYTIAMMALGDGFIFMAFLVTGMFVDAAFLSLVSTAFLAFLCVCFFGMKFMMDVWSVQAPEREERRRQNALSNAVATEVAPAEPAPTIVANTSETNILPPPVTAHRAADTGAMPIILPPDQDLDAAEADDNATTQPAGQTATGSTRREMGNLYSRFFLLLLGIMFLSLHATSWPTVLRSAYCNGTAFIYLSFWTPQIYRNIMRNCRKAFRWEFVIGQSLLRLGPFFYFYTMPNNILYVETDWNAAYVLIGLVWIQIWALASQEILGPRTFIPHGWAPPAYDYHPILREDDEESGAAMPIGFSQATPASPSSATRLGESKENGNKIFDCAICMQNIEVAVVPSGHEEGGTSVALATKMFSRRAYMVTPCRHIFHSACLEGWMRYRLQCPICRDNLPPL